MQKQENQKQEKIVSMFDDIAPTYDTANRVMSMGVDKSWRRKACDLAFEFYSKDSLDKIVDVACGTGDMMDFWKKRSEVNGIAVGEIVGVDPSNGMVDVAKEKYPTYHIGRVRSCDDMSSYVNLVDKINKHGKNK
jgi:demethylmenaquinone methyltransferase/2-methoxy-6-polyprenyl-1,4-benzoquinol methylase